MITNRVKGKWVLLFLAFLILLLIILGMLKFFGDFFPKAGAIQYPNVEKIISLEISHGMDKWNVADIESIRIISDKFLSAKATRRQSVHDGPVVSDFYVVNFQLENGNRMYTSYLYMENGNTYIEQPYWGIYKVDGDIILLIDRSDM